MGSIGGYAKGQHPAFRHFHRLNRNYNANLRIKQWTYDLALQNYIASMPRWRVFLFHLGGRLQRPLDSWIAGHEFKAEKPTGYVLSP